MKKYFVKNSLDKNIEPEEIFLDSENQETQKIEFLFGDERFLKLKKIIILAFAFLAIQAGYLQIVKGKYYKERAQGNYVKTDYLKAPRGIVYDQLGKQIVFNAPSFDLVLIPADFFRNKNQQRQNSDIEKLSAAIGQPREIIKNIAADCDKNSYAPILIAGNLEKETAMAAEILTGEIEGVELAGGYVRNYVDSRQFAGIIGYTGKINQEELEQYPDYLISDNLGKDGLELFYEKELRGEYGRWEIAVDSLGKMERTLSQNEPLPGNNLVLNINGELQKKIYEELKEMAGKLKTERAAAVAINPQNGAVISLVNYPGYNNNLFAKGISRNDYLDLLNNPANPLFNGAISGEYPPGSTFKPFMAAAALEEKVITSRTTFLSAGGIWVSRWFFPDWQAGGHGSVDVIKAIAQSVNTFFYIIGGGYNDTEGLGIGGIKKYAELFGLGNKLGIDLPSESAGLVPDENWKKNKVGESWYIGDTYHVSIGQGYLTATPLQIAAAATAIANGGTLFKPQVVSKIKNSQGDIIKDIQPEIIRENFISRENIDWVRKGMREGAISGSSRQLFNLPVAAAGKTGTAQFNKNKEPHAWSVSFAPYEDPEIVLVVLVEEGGEGHRAAVPVAKNVLEWYFTARKHSPDQYQ